MSRYFRPPRRLTPLPLATRLRSLSLASAASITSLPLWQLNGARRRRLEMPENLSPEEEAEYREAFNSFDLDSSGRIDVFELGNAMRLIGMQPDKATISSLIKEVDYNEDGEIDFVEFCHCLRRFGEQAAAKEEEEAARGNLDSDGHEAIARACFEVFDQNRDGIITPEEFHFVMKELGEFSEAFSERIYREADVTGNGTIDFDEFAHFVRSYLFDEESSQPGKSSDE